MVPRLRGAAYYAPLVAAEFHGVEIVGTVGSPPAALLRRRIALRAGAAGWLLARSRPPPSGLERPIRRLTGGGVGARPV
eukprot:7077028-Pyramimonas_sp.AAC.1